MRKFYDFAGDFHVKAGETVKLTFYLFIYLYLDSIYVLFLFFLH